MNKPITVFWLLRRTFQRNRRMRKKRRKEFKTKVHIQIIIINIIIISEDSAKWRINIHPCGGDGTSANCFLQYYNMHIYINIYRCKLEKNYYECKVSNGKRQCICMYVSSLTHRDTNIHDKHIFHSSVRDTRACALITTDVHYITT